MGQVKAKEIEKLKTLEEDFLYRQQQKQQRLLRHGSAAREQLLKMQQFQGVQGKIQQRGGQARMKARLKHQNSPSPNAIPPRAGSQLAHDKLERLNQGSGHLQRGFAHIASRGLEVAEPNLHEKVEEYLLRRKQPSALQVRPKEGLYNLIDSHN